MPDLTPTPPLQGVPAPPAEEADLPTVPHSLAPLSASSEEEEDSAWGEVWRRRWLVAGAAAVAFLSALAFGRLTASKHPLVPPPTVSGISAPSQVDTPASGAEPETSPQATSESPSPRAADTTASAKEPTTPTPAATSDDLEIPPMEVPASSGKSPARRAERPTSTAPRKRFTPSAL